MKTRLTLHLDDEDKAHIEKLKVHFRVRTESAAVLSATKEFMKVQTELTRKIMSEQDVAARLQDLEQLVNDLVGARADELRAWQRLTEWADTSLAEESHGSPH